MQSSEWSAFVVELSHMPDVAARLVTEHHPDARGFCVVCLRPGYGTPHTRFPCGSWALGDAALRRLRLPA